MSFRWTKKLFSREYYVICDEKTTQVKKVYFLSDKNVLTCFKLYNSLVGTTHGSALENERLIVRIRVLGSLQLWMCLGKRFFFLYNENENNTMICLWETKLTASSAPNLENLGGSLFEYGSKGIFLFKFVSLQYTNLRKC